MARDPRKSSAFDSGMRGKEKPKVSGNTGGDRGSRGPDGGAGSESKQAAGATVGTPGGVDLSAYTSGMRGPEKPKQKSAGGDATKQPGGAGGGESHQAGGHVVGQPSGHSDAGSGPRKGVTDAHLQTAGKNAKTLGIAGNNTEDAAAGHDPDGEGILGEEDDTHINIRIPKASLKRKNPGLQTN